jgi:hypothetical protein
MKIRVGDPELVDSLLGFLESMGIPVAPSSAETIVALPELADDVVTRLEVEMYLKLWEARSDTRQAELIEEPSAADTAEL